MQYIFTMDTSTISRVLNFIASWCLIFSSLMVRYTSSFPTTSYPSPSPSGTSFGIELDDKIRSGHAMLVDYVTTLTGRHNHVFEEYKKSRFTNNRVSCSGSFTINGLPPHHRLGEPYDMTEADLLMTHHYFVQQYVEIMKAAIDDESQYEKPDNFVRDRNREFESFITIENWLKRVQSTLKAQIELEELQEIGLILFLSDDTFRFTPESDESFRNIRVLCVLEDLYEYLPRLLQDTRIMKNSHL